MSITLTGNNEFTLSQELNKLLAALTTEVGDFGVERYDGEDLDPQKLPGIIQAMPFLAPKRVVVLRQPSAQKLLAERLEKLLDKVPESTELIIVERRPDKRTSYYKALQKRTDLRSYDALNEQQLADWLRGLATEAGGQLSAGDARYLVQRIGLNQQLLSNELKKLLTYNPQITRQAIDQLTEPAPQSTIFSLLDAAFRGDRRTVLDLYHEQRQQKVEPLAMLAMIAWQLHIFALIKTAGERSPQTIASETKVSPYVIQKSISASRSFSLAQLKGWIHRAAELDVQLKSRPIDADEALMQFLLDLS
jgi:DNA polymerase-3 subunit delta